MKRPKCCVSATAFIIQMTAKCSSDIHPVATTLFLLSFMWIQPSLQVQERLDRTGKYSYMKGDVYLALLETVSKATREPGICNFKARSVSVLQRIKAVQFAIEAVNTNVSLLPGIKLGLLVLDDCESHSAALLRASAVVPKQKLCSGRQGNDSHFNVVGVVGCNWDGGAIAASLRLAPYHIPVISHAAKADSLSNKGKHPNFLRLIPSNEHQIKAMVDFIVFQGWNLFSIVFSQVYGLPAFRSVLELSKQMKICIDAEIAVDINLPTIECISIVKLLLTAYTAKVVVVFTPSVDSVCFVRAIQTLQVQDQLVWIASDTWTSLFTQTVANDHFPAGLFVFSFEYFDLPGFQEFLSESDNDHRFWFEERLENTDFCQTKPCNVTHILSSQTLQLSSATLYDIVYTFAHALHRLIRHHCPHATRVNTYTCICQHKRGFLKYLRQTHFYGLTGLVRFDEKGSRPSIYNILHAYANAEGKILFNLTASYDIRSREILQEHHDIWSGFKGNAAPESTCNKPCRPNELKIMLGCCWICKACKPNEVFIGVGAMCVPCPHFERPHHHHRHCVPMPRKFPLRISNIGAIVTLVLVAIGIVSTKCIFLFYVINRNHIVILSSNFMLSIVQIISMLIGYISVLLFLSVPSEKVCTAAFTLLPFSFNILYAAAFLKAVRLYRTFRSSSDPRAVMFVSHRAESTLIAIIIVCQIASHAGLDVMLPISVGLRQKQATSFVEIYCSIPRVRITVFLMGNVFLLLLCSYFSLQTRVLPNRFTENIYVVKCVVTTIITWLASLPAVNVLDHTAVQTLILCGMVILNLMTATVFLFSFRLYEFFMRTDQVLQQEFSLVYRRYALTRISRVTK